LRAANERKRRERDHDVEMAYLGAYLQRVKNFPSLESLLGGVEAPSQEEIDDLAASWDEIEAATDRPVGYKPKGYKG
jgi:hypothetical protein